MYITLNRTIAPKRRKENDDILYIFANEHKESEERKAYLLPRFYSTNISHLTSYTQTYISSMFITIEELAFFSYPQQSGDEKDVVCCLLLK